MMQTVRFMQQKDAERGVFVETVACEGEGIFDQKVSNMIEIRPSDYAAVARELAERIESTDFVNTTVHTSDDMFDSSLTATLIVYRSECPSATSMRPIIDVVPVWWEFHTYTPDGDEQINDFSFAELKPYLTELP